MITIQLRDKNLIENMKDIETLREFFSDEEIQRMYDEQVKKDNK